MKNMLIEIFKPTPIELTLEELEKKLYGRIIAGKTKENILNDLKLLELEGKIFYDARNNTYKTFPSNFFITKITSVKDNEFYFKINSKEYNLPNKNSLKKKDTIILERVHNRFKFIKAIPNIEQEKSNDYDRIVDLFDAYNKSYSLHALAKMLKTDDLTTLQNTLTSLEEQGKVYFNEDENKYQPFPKQYKIVTIETGKKGFYYIRNKDSIYPLKDEETTGILPFDKVILEKTKDGFNIIKVLKRNNPNIICEVTEKGIRVVGNNNIKVRCNEKEFKDLKLPVGTRILVKIGTKETNKVYDVSFIEVTGHKNDLTSELEAIACNNGFITRYTKEELEQINSIPKEVLEKDKIGRIDLTNETIFTIDGANTKDMDDAVGITKTKDNKYILTVPIAHVSHYIPYNSPLWIRASKNTTSLYLANHVLHMLHPIISNGICSLNPNVERLAKTYRMTINENGYVENLEIFDSVIKSKKKMTYEDVNQIFYENTVPEGYEPFLKDLSLLQELSHIIENRRIKNGSLEFDSKEIEFLETEDSLNLSAKTQKEAEKIIANCMIITNEAIADYTLNLCLISIYRNHEIPMDEKLRVTLKLIKSIGYKIECLKDTTDPHVLQKIINSLSTKEEFFILSSLLLKSMQKAYYSTNNAGHYGLALDGYSQVTSPIRRFMDLIIEYILDNIEIMLDPSFDVENFKNELEEYAKRASIMERCADKAEYEANKLYMVKYVKEHFDETFEGFIQDITPHGLIIKTQELIEGIIFFEDLDDGLYTYNKECRWLEHKNNNKKIMIGTKLLLTPKDLDEEFRVIYFNGNSNNLVKDQLLTRKKD